MRRESNRKSEDPAIQKVSLKVKNTLTGEEVAVFGTIHGKPTHDATRGGRRRYRIDIDEEYRGKGIPEYVEEVFEYEFKRLSEEPESGFVG